MEKTHQEIELEPVIKIEEWIFLLLLAMIPIVNLVSFIYYSFSKRLNTNKRNFAKAVLTYLIVLMLLVILTTVLR